jgi:hypothetical protein
MKKLTLDTLYSNDQYAAIRATYQTESKFWESWREIILGGHLKVTFQTQQSARLAIQETLLENDVIDQKEISMILDLWNRIVPDDSVLKAVLKIYPADPDGVKIDLDQIKDVEKYIYIKVPDHPKIYAQSQDYENSNYLLCFELSDDIISSLKDKSTPVTVGVDHPLYSQHMRLSEMSQFLIVSDLSDQ